jgi:hypothetical protein
MLAMIIVTLPSRYIYSMKLQSYIGWHAYCKGLGLRPGRWFCCWKQGMCAKMSFIPGCQLGGDLDGCSLRRTHPHHCNRL